MHLPPISHFLVQHNFVVAILDRGGDIPPKRVGISQTLEEIRLTRLLPYLSGGRISLGARLYLVAYTWDEVRHCTTRWLDQCVVQCHLSAHSVHIS